MTLTNANLRPPDLNALAALLDVLHYLPQGVVFVKDAQARYVYANDTLLRRLHISDLSELQGRTPEEVFPAPLGRGYRQQDLSVLTGQTLTEHLERHLYPGGQVGWCLTTKRPIYDQRQRVTGLVGLSRDLSLPAKPGHNLSAAIEALQEHHAEPLNLADLAARCGLSVSTFERQVKKLYGATPKQLLVRARIEAATRLLENTDWPVARVAAECGYFDHSAFTRVFKATVGLTPLAFRRSGKRP